MKKITIPHEGMKTDIINEIINKVGCLYSHLYIIKYSIFKKKITIYFNTSISENEEQNILNTVKKIII